MHDLCAIVPVPFKKGDILKFKAAGKINYGVLACNLSNEKYTIEEIAVDIFDKDEDGNWKYGYDHVSIFEIEICGKEGLPNEYEILKDYSDLQRGKISSREFFLYLALCKLIRINNNYKWSRINGTNRKL